MSAPFTGIVITAVRPVIDVTEFTDGDAVLYERGATETRGEVTGDARRLREFWERGELVDLSVLSESLEGEALFADCPQRLDHSLARAPFRVSGLAVIGGRALLEGWVTIPGPRRAPIFRDAAWGSKAQQGERMEGRP